MEKYKQMKNMTPYEIDWRIRVFDSLSFPTLILNPNRTIISANEILLKKIGVDLEQIIGDTCKNIFHKYFYDTGLLCSGTECPLNKTLEDKKPHSVIRKFTGSDDKEIWEERACSPILNNKGEVKYIIESVRDITRVKVLEQEISGVREFMDKAIQSSASAIIAADMKGKIIIMNQAAEDLFGYKFDEINQINIRDLYPVGVAQDIMKKLRGNNIGKKGKLPMTKVSIITKQAEEVPAEMTAAIIHKGGREVASMGIFNDLREKMAVKKQLSEARTQVEQSEKMASLGRLAAGVAHEINNPLTGILLYANMMLEKFQKDHPLRSNLEYIIEDSERCRDIVKNLLAYSRQTSPSKQIFQLNELLEESLGLIRDQKLFMNVTLKKKTDPDPILINADRNQLNQVIINLVINAIDAMDKKGVLTFLTYRDAEAEKAFLEIIDTGLGISDEHISKIFDPFFTTKELGKGTGLGLSTAYGIMEENNGRISVKKTGPEGTAILLEMPAVSTENGLLFESIG